MHLYIAAALQGEGVQQQPGVQRTSDRTGVSVRGSVTTSLASLVQQGVNHIKMWIPSSRHLYLTRIVDALMEQRGGSSLGVE
jgi:hypothetical protein